MTTYNVHIYREMRLVFGGIEADSPEAAAAIARDKPTDNTDSIDDCEGENIAALVDVQGDEEYAQSRLIDFEPARERQAAPKLLAALKDLLGDRPSIRDFQCVRCGRDYHDIDEWAIETGDCPSDDCPSHRARAAIAKAESASISPEPAGPSLRTALEYALEFLEANDDGEDDVVARIAVATAALAKANAAGILPDRSVVARVMYDTLAYVAEMLSGFKPDFLANIGLGVALEKVLAALNAAEALPPATPESAGVADPPTAMGDPAKKSYSVLLFYPDYANDSGTETYYAFVEASEPFAAIAAAQRQALAINEWDDMNPGNFTPLLVIEGHHYGQPIV